MLKEQEKIGAYTLVERLGLGSFGEVWRAEKRNALGTSEFALKFIRPHDGAEINLEAVRKELLVGQKVSGLPHIIQLIEAEIHDEFVYLVSEYADGGSLEKWLKRSGGKARSFEQAVEIASEILKGLEGLHRQGYIHRDLKPGNVLIKKGTYCLADFGISRQMQTNSATMTTAGTCYYMPPEAFVKKPLVSIHTDIWAVGVILQQLLTGELPFPQDDLYSLMWAVKEEEPEPLPVYVPSELRAVIAKALQKKREDRFQSAREMRLQLEKTWEAHVSRSTDAATQEIDAGAMTDAAHFAPTLRGDSAKNTVSDAVTVENAPAQNTNAEARTLTNQTSSRPSRRAFFGLLTGAALSVAAVVGAVGFFNLSAVAPTGGGEAAPAVNAPAVAASPAASAPPSAVSAGEGDAVPSSAPPAAIDPKSSKPKAAVAVPKQNPPAAKPAKPNNSPPKPRDERCILKGTC